MALVGLAPPEMTAKSWAVADAKSGNILWHSKAEQKLEIASMTKMLTFLVILHELEEDSSLIEEEVLVSEASCTIGGTTANLREGDMISVWDLLYGMMLPSGNDAAHALALHFGETMALREESEIGL